MEFIANDVLRQILFMFNDPQYIRVVERVCKRWKNISRLRTSISSNRHGPMAILKLYPKLTHCQVPLRLFYRNKHILDEVKMKYISLHVSVQHMKCKRSIKFIRALIERAVKDDCKYTINIVHYMEYGATMLYHEITIEQQSMTLVSSIDWMINDIVGAFTIATEGYGSVTIMIAKYVTVDLDDHDLASLSIYKLN